jgi:hypothetical protein
MPEPLGWVVEHTQGGFVGGFRSGIARITLDPLPSASAPAPSPICPTTA